MGIKIVGPWMHEFYIAQYWNEIKIYEYKNMLLNNKWTVL